MTTGELESLVAQGGESRDWALEFTSRLTAADKANLAALVRSRESRLRDSALLCIYVLAEQGDDAIEPGLQELLNEDDPMLIRKAERAIRALDRSRRRSLKPGE